MPLPQKRVALAGQGREKRDESKGVVVRARTVATTTPDATVEAVAQLMINLRISGVPVLDRNGSGPRYLAPLFPAP